LTLGCPVLCTNVGGLKDIVNDKCGKLCNSDWEFCDELYKLLTDAEYIDKKSEEAIQHSMYFDNIVSYREMLSRIYSEYTVKGIVL
jgi:Glycosyltransferase